MKFGSRLLVVLFSSPSDEQFELVATTTTTTAVLLYLAESSFLVGKQNWNFKQNHGSCMRRRSNLVFFRRNFKPCWICILFLSLNRSDLCSYLIPVAPNMTWAIVQGIYANIFMAFSPCITYICLTWPNTLEYIFFSFRIGEERISMHKTFLSLPLWLDWIPLTVCPWGSEILLLFNKYIPFHSHSHSVEQLNWFPEL